MRSFGRALMRKENGNDKSKTVKNSGAKNKHIYLVQAILKHL
jgi:hypothetical protein